MRRPSGVESVVSTFWEEIDASDGRIDLLQPVLLQLRCFVYKYDVILDTLVMV